MTKWILLVVMLALPASAQISLPGCDETSPTGVCNTGDDITGTDLENIRLFVDGLEDENDTQDGTIAALTQTVTDVETAFGEGDILWYTGAAEPTAANTCEPTTPAIWIVTNAGTASLGVCTCVASNTWQCTPNLGSSFGACTDLGTDASGDFVCND